MLILPLRICAAADGPALNEDSPAEAEDGPATALNEDGRALNVYSPAEVEEGFWTAEGLLLRGGLSEQRSIVSTGAIVEWRLC